MADFLSDLWTSVFTPGPTPTLLVATNATFAALQLLLLVLLVATYSIHFFALSFLTAGLWWAINWFARELVAAREKEEEAKRIRGARRRQGGAGSSGRAGDGQEAGAGMDSGDDTDTETEAHVTALGNPPFSALKERPTARSSRVSSEKDEAQPSGLQRNRPSSGVPLEHAHTSLAPPLEGNLATRRSSGDLAELSTDSEWEKVGDDQ